MGAAGSVRLAGKAAKQVVGTGPLALAAKV